MFLTTLSYFLKILYTFTRILNINYTYINYSCCMSCYWTKYRAVTS